MPKLSTSAVSPLLNQRLIAYAVAAAGAVSFAPSANAQIVYTKANAILTGGALPIDLDRDGVADFLVEASRTSTGYNRFVFLSVAGKGSEAPAVVGLRQGALAIPKGVQIGSNAPGSFLPASTQAPVSLAHVWQTYNGVKGAGHWANVDDKYLGLRFTLADGVHYGWARLSVKARSTGFPNVVAKLTGFAYETTPNKSIVAGDRGFSSNSPNSGSLGALALGAAKSTSGHN